MKKTAILGCVLALGITLLSACSSTSNDEPIDYRQIEWTALHPDYFTPDWVQSQLTMPETNVSQLSDNDPAVQDIYQNMLEIFKNAPVVDTLNDEYIKMPGFAVPLEFIDSTVTSFLLVPYFGACIHTPPPPANQIVYVEYPAGFEMVNNNIPVWVSGLMKVESKDSDMGFAGYTLIAQEVVEFEPI